MNKCRFIVLSWLIYGTLMAQGLQQSPSQPAPATSGFLSDYSRLTPFPSSGESKLLNYIAPGQHHLGHIYIAPVSSYPTDANFSLIDRATLAALTSQFETQLRTKLKQHFSLVDTVEQADSTITMAVTAVTAIEPKRKPRDYLPFRLITKPIKDATMGKQQELLVTLEMRIDDSKTKQVIFESLQTEPSKKIGRTDDTDLHADIKSLAPVIEGWVNHVNAAISRIPS